MSLLVVGTVCTDTIETPAGRADRVLGGSGAYAAVAAALLGPVRLVGPVGDDFPPQHRELFATRGIDLAGLATVPGARTQFWHGRYHDGLHTRDHVAVDMDVLDAWRPVVPDEFRDGTHVFLGHMPPHPQLAVLDQLPGPGFVMADTIDHWITTRREEVVRLFGRVNAVAVNDGEAQLLTGERNALKAARLLRRMGPQLVIVKKGEHGLLLHPDDEFVALPAFPTEAVVDPTGAGDTFAGALAAGLAAGFTLERAAAVGAVAASFTVEGFGLSRLAAVTADELARRLTRYREMLTV